MPDTCRQTTPQIIGEWLDVIAQIMAMGILAAIGAAYVYLILGQKEYQHNG